MICSWYIYIPDSIGYYYIVNCICSLDSTIKYFWIHWIFCVTCHRGKEKQIKGKPGWHFSYYNMDFWHLFLIITFHPIFHFYTKVSGKKWLLSTEIATYYYIYLYILLKLISAWSPIGDLKYICTWYTPLRLFPKANTTSTEIQSINAITYLIFLYLYCYIYHYSSCGDIYLLDKISQDNFQTFFAIQSLLTKMSTPVRSLLINIYST